MSVPSRLLSDFSTENSFCPVLIRANLTSTCKVSPFESILITSSGGTGDLPRSKILRNISVESRTRDFGSQP